MKYIYLLLISWSVVACQQPGKATENETNQPGVVSSEVYPAPLEEEEKPDLTDVIADEIYLNGVLALPPQNFASVTLVMGGIVHDTRLMPGAYVQKGAVLAMLENIDFVDLQQSYLEASAQTDFLEEEYNRQRKLSEQEAASKKRFQESKAEYLSMKSKKDAAAAQLQMLGISTEDLMKEGIRTYLAVKAPISGFITGMNLNVGKYFQAGEHICEIVDKGQVMLNLTVYEKDIPFLLPGEQLTFVVNGIPGKEFPATILSIGQEVDMASRSLEVYAKVEGNHELFRPGMYVTARVNKK